MAGGDLLSEKGEKIVVLLFEATECVRESAN